MTGKKGVSKKKKYSRQVNDDIAVTDEIMKLKEHSAINISVYVLSTSKEVETAIKYINHATVSSTSSFFKIVPNSLSD